MGHSHFELFQISNEYYYINQEPSVPAWLDPVGTTTSRGPVDINAAEIAKIIRLEISNISLPWTPTTRGLANDAYSELRERSLDWFASIDLAGSILRLNSLINIEKGGKQAIFVVVNCEMEPMHTDTRPTYGMMDSETVIEIIKPQYTHPLSRLPDGNLAGYDSAAALLKNALSWLDKPSRIPEPFMFRCRGVMLTGAPGAGKRFLARYYCLYRHVLHSTNTQYYYFHLAEEAAYRHYMDSTSQIISSTPLSKLVEQILLSSPCALLLDGLELLYTNLEWVDPVDSLIQAVISQIARIGYSDTCIIATCKDLDILPKGLMHYFPTVLNIGYPNAQQRKAILECVLSKFQIGDSSEIASALSRSTAGFVARHLNYIIERTVMPDVSTIKSLSNMMSETFIAPRKHAFELEAFEGSVRHYAVYKNAENESPKTAVSWSDIGGYCKEIGKLKRLLYWPQEHPEVFKRMGSEPASGILLYGPSGCGKSLLVKALAYNSTMNFISLSSDQIFCKYLGESEQVLRSAFKRAANLSPCILFIDDLDTVALRRDTSEGTGNSVDGRILSTLLNEMDGIAEHAGVVVIACTNQPAEIDDALIRPGRFDRLVHIGLPTYTDRMDILALLGIKTKLEIVHEEMQIVAESTNGWTPADLVCLVR